MTNSPVVDGRVSPTIRNVLEGSSLGGRSRLQSSENLKGGKV